MGKQFVGKSTIGSESIEEMSIPAKGNHKKPFTNTHAA